MFVDEVLVELEAKAKDSDRPLRSGPKPPLAGTALRKAVMAVWCVCFCGMQWRAIGQLCDIPFGTLYGLFACWTRLGLWRRMLDRLRRTWRRAGGDAPEPSAVVIDSRSCRSARRRDLHDGRQRWHVWGLKGVPPSVLVAKPFAGARIVMAVSQRLNARGA